MTAKQIEGNLDARDLRIAIVVSRFNSFITERLMEGAMDCIRRHGGSDNEVTIVRVPGSWEIPLAAQQLAKNGRHDGIIALGAVIRGATPHFDYVAAETSKGIAGVSLATGIPIAFGVLTTDTIEQAVERSGTKSGNKGFDAALSVLEMIDVMRRLASLS